MRPRPKAKSRIDPECDSLVAGVNAPCLMMADRSGEQLVIGLANPDLGLLDPDADAPDHRWISKNDNQYRPSRTRPVELTLHGR